jgi:hypothetical protein
MPDNAQINRIIQDALDHHTNDRITNRPGRNNYERVRNAWLWVVDQRNRNGMCDDNWAIADHYLNARFMVITGDTAGDWTFSSVFYNSVKFVADVGDGIVNFVSNGLVGRSVNMNTPNAPTRQVLSEGNCIVSPPSLQAIEWARRGGIDGVSDRQNPNHTRRLIVPTSPGAR